MKETAGFIMHADDADMYDELTPDEFYNVVYGAFRYCISGQTPSNLTRCEKLIFKQLAKRIDNDKERYEKVRAARSAAGKKSAAIRYQKSSPESKNQDDEDDYEEFFINVHGTEHGSAEPAVLSPHGEVASASEAEGELVSPPTGIRAKGDKPLDDFMLHG